jgi:hypothetical protein
MLHPRIGRFQVRIDAGRTASKLSGPESEQTGPASEPTGAVAVLTAPDLSLTDTVSLLPGRAPPLSDAARSAPGSVQSPPDTDLALTGRASSPTGGGSSTAETALEVTGSVRRPAMLESGAYGHEPALTSSGSPPIEPEVDPTGTALAPPCPSLVLSGIARPPNKETRGPPASRSRMRQWDKRGSSLRFPPRASPRPGLGPAAGAPRPRTWRGIAVRPAQPAGRTPPMRWSVPKALDR